MRAGKGKFTLIHQSFLKQQQQRIFPDSNVPYAETIWLWIPACDYKHDMNLTECLHIKEHLLQSWRLCWWEEANAEMRLLQSHAIYHFSSKKRNSSNKKKKKNVKKPTQPGEPQSLTTESASLLPNEVPDAIDLELVSLLRKKHQKHSVFPDKM